MGGGIKGMSPPHCWKSVGMSLFEKNLSQFYLLSLNCKNDLNLKFKIRGGGTFSRGTQNLWRAPRAAPREPPGNFHKPPLAICLIFNILWKIQIYVYIPKR